MTPKTAFAIITGLLVATQVLGYPPQGRLMPDGAPVPEGAGAHEDSVAAASEAGGDEYDDSDMYMEPDGAESSPGDQTSASAQHTVNEEAIAIVDETLPEVLGKLEDRAEVLPSSENAGLRREFVDKSLESESQNFFPSFAQLFTNHRLPYEEQQQQQHYRPNRFLGYFQRERDAYNAPAEDQPHPLLGSGNFGVIRGGTYYSDDKDKDEYSVGETLFNPYFHGLNPRAKSNYYRNPKPQPVRGGDFFANFRDFADITAPPKSSFSHLSIVYANKNGTADRVAEPRNIIETLRMLEEESELTTTEIPQKKISNGKRKLLKLKKYQEDKSRKSRMAVEPLLALS
ncbi:uncharacterized protein LOC124184654 isoform X2 [Neodiprion fabricii]|uniref:uncharacterized protein LOC124184654 isoform X2 n=1 Tax=Neodiprion fabricii TaxID=2872261 RepID=UPI001ED94F88|nr:uncharacterized protein LOC124184654 isoform X2 [Neodiprion fabricii]